MNVRRGFQIFAPESAHYTELQNGIQLLGQADFVAAGHRMGRETQLSRRVATACLNASVWRTFNRFADAVEAGFSRRMPGAGSHPQGTDGGTMPLAGARTMPVQSILSAHAACILGIALHSATFVKTRCCSITAALRPTLRSLPKGRRFWLPEGISINGRPTLVRAMQD
jgi:hypothetical protein